jgi:hypothetical protein
MIIYGKGRDGAKTVRVLISYTHNNIIQQWVSQEYFRQNKKEMLKNFTKLLNSQRDGKVSMSTNF